MIITIVCDVLGKENNGTTVATTNLINYLKAKGHTVRILCADQDKIGKKNIFVVPNMNFGKILNNYVKKVGVALAKPQKDIIAKALDGTDHVHIMLPLSLGVATIKIANQMGISSTAGFHMQAENLTSYIKLNRFKFVNKLVYKIIYKKLYKNVDAIHYPTQFIRDIFEKTIKTKTNGYVISNGVNKAVKKKQVQKPNNLKNKIVILSTGRYAREKRQDLLIKAINISKFKDKIQLILAGVGIKEKKYKKLAKNLKVQSIFKYFNRQQIIDVINYSDIYVHPAETELEGIACLEAITCGKLTIVSDSKNAATSGFAVDEKCIFKNGSYKDLARVLDYWIEHKEQRKIYAQKYLNSAVAYNQDECMQKMEDMLVEVHNLKK